MQDISSKIINILNIDDEDRRVHEFLRFTGMSEADINEIDGETTEEKIIDYFNSLDPAVTYDIVERINEINDDNIRLSVVGFLNVPDEVKERFENLTDNISDKVELIATYKSDETKLEKIKKIDGIETYHISKILCSLFDDNLKRENLNKFLKDDEYSLSKVIESYKDDKLKCEDIEKFNISSPYLANILVSFNLDELKEKYRDRLADGDISRVIASYHSEEKKDRIYRK